ncbi:hypothetical protein [Roseateles amylovorans]|uniref:DUF4148 domain-containing protein n=1 Tax=Roseateles amylovorans TaxID=2978473 RepID=A0ABY6B5E0_9BURK|nr:hypothetical protein [Roseateles amylovorans]UXH79755.1 hypothetical protein N4261_07640 [Roseateles amylovorans]
MSRSLRRPSRLRILSASVLGLALLAPTAPVQASEVVKLARLLITGKRQPSRPPAAPAPAPTDRSGSAEGTGPQTRSSDNAELHAASQRRGPEAALTMVD